MNRATKLMALVGVFTVLSSFCSTIQSSVEVKFDKGAIGIEEGQPVYPKEAKIWVANEALSVTSISVNGESADASQKEIVLSDLIKNSPGSYTVEISYTNSEGQDETFTMGFTLK